jgi:CheY-like chemotaxis protein
MSPNRLSNLTIVVVEDHDDARRYLGLFLDRLGVNVVVARNAFEGLGAIKTSRPNLVLSEITMPGMDGFELLRTIRALGRDAGGSVGSANLKQLTHYEITRLCTNSCTYMPGKSQPDCIQAAWQHRFPPLCL